MSAVDELLREAVRKDGTDVHISVDLPALMRYRGELFPLNDRRLSRAETRSMIFEILSPDQRKYLEANKEMDFAYRIPGMNRFRCSAFFQRLGLDASFHVIPNKIPKLEEIGLPSVALEFTTLNQGLLLVAGPRGCGKSTTQAALIDHINSTRKRHIITVEEPIEFIHQNKQSLINQREVGLHTASFAGALRQALRADPDIILVGEMRDLETISMAITAAETGHLVLGTLHTTSAVQTVDRVVDVFPGTQKLQIRMMVSESLKGVICQQLVRSTRKNEMEIVVEILVGSASVANLIREGKTFQIPSMMQMGASLGMQTMDDSLLALLKKHRITYEDAILRATDKKKFLHHAPMR